MRSVAVLFAFVGTDDGMLGGFWASAHPRRDELPLKIQSQFYFVIEADKEIGGSLFDYRIAVASGDEVVDIMDTATFVVPMRVHPEVPASITMQHELAFDVEDYGRYEVRLYVNDEIVCARAFAIYEPTQDAKPIA